ncbi:histidine phosphatase family protein [Marivibrio halodurans]|uniref:Histidine phosphatase family protein n=1 Tax=Marivibrio halodurans TaxID=2039722 RepID=A0A8J7RZX0_9PROT|nr:histidine phosphatase family protein [Marivibrio halodurans]MBP5856123.1 histidine phosphatase family protein [Marivibrio halodurans]
MLTLFLLRHAKSSWSDQNLPDFDRPLAPRGHKAAPRIGAYMADRGFAPGRILCSSAQRTRETLALVLPHLDGDCDVTLTRSVYESNDEHDLLALIAAQSAPPFTPRPVTGAHRLMLIGHNPAMQDLALALAGNGAPDDRAALAEKFPTAALAVLTFDGTDGWAGLAPGSGLLTHFIRPRDLD